MFRNWASTFTISFIFCLISFYLVRIADNLILSGFLRLNNICHEYHTLYIIYKNGQIDNWTEGELIFINSVPYLLAILTGIYLPHFFRNQRSRLIQLAVTWYSFQLVLLFTGGLVSGLFEYSGIGISIVWFIKYKSLQVISVIITLLALTWSLRRYAWYYIRCLPDCEEIFDTQTKINMLKKIALYPFVFSSIIVLAFNSIETILNHSISLFCGLLLIILLFHVVTDVFIPRAISPPD